MEYDPLRRAVAEFVGTFALVFVGVASVVVAVNAGVGIAGVALAHGLVIAVMVSAVGHISGGHFNPAVTVALLVTRRMAPTLAAIYVATQLAAALVAALLLRAAFTGGEVDLDVGAPRVETEAIGVSSGLLIEIVLTFFLVWVVFATAVDPRGTFKSIAGLAIGLTITFDILAGGPFTGAAMNPARAFGPQLVQDVWDDGWVYYVGPLLGGVGAALLYEFLYLRPLAPIPVGPPETGVVEPRPGDTAAS